MNFDDVRHIDGRKADPPLHRFYGSYDFIRQPQEKADITLNEKHEVCRKTQNPSIGGHFILGWFIYL